MRGKGGLSGRRWTPWIKEQVTVMGQEQTLYSNNRYHVFLRKEEPVGDCPYGVVWLSIRNNDRSTRRDWRDFQRIKNEIVGPDREMVEIYPQEGHKVDTSNQYHLWGYDTERAVFAEGGLGWREGRKVWNGISTPRQSIPGTEKAVQRPSEEESTI
jgi:hypothetical protein